MQKRCRICAPFSGEFDRIHCRAATRGPPCFAPGQRQGTDLHPLHGFEWCFVGDGVLDVPAECTDFRIFCSESAPLPFCHSERSEAESRDLGNTGKENSAHLSNCRIPSGGTLSERSERMQRIAEGKDFIFSPLRIPH